MKHINKPISQPNFMLVSGNGRNVGKTSFVCAVISAVSKHIPVKAIKISPHFHKDKNSDEIIFGNNDFIIRKESRSEGTKDSSRMLQAGAEEVYYIEVNDDHLQTAILELQKYTDLKGPVICESGGMRHIFKPSLFFVVNRSDRDEQKEGFTKLAPLANKIILFDGKEFDFSPEDIFFDNNSWNIK